jgi:hypothetical protein
VHGGLSEKFKAKWVAAWTRRQPGHEVAQDTSVRGNSSLVTIADRRGKGLQRYGILKLHECQWHVLLLLPWSPQAFCDEFSPATLVFGVTIAMQLPEKRPELRRTSLAQLDVE